MPQLLRQKPRSRRRNLYWQERRDSNPQPPVLETGALPIELLSYRLTETRENPVFSDFTLNPEIEAFKRQSRLRPKSHAAEELIRSASSQRDARPE